MFKIGNTLGKVVKSYKICAICGKEQALRGRSRSPNCTDCNYKKNYETFKSVRRPYNLKRSYNLSISDFNNMVNHQNHSCGICYKVLNTKDFAVDHNHTTNKVRGLLCHPCNRGLGQFKDNYELLLGAARYILEKDYGK